MKLLFLLSLCLGFLATGCNTTADVYTEQMHVLHTYKHRDDHVTEFRMLEDPDIVCVLVVSSGVRTVSCVNRAVR